MQCKNVETRANGASVRIVLYNYGNHNQNYVPANYINPENIR